MRPQILTVITMLLLTILSLTANAQQNLKKSTKVIFPAGQTSVTFKGQIEGLQAQQLYIFRARRGQVLTVRLTTGNGKTTFAVFNSKDDEAIGGPADEEHLSWKDTLSAADEYSVIVSTLSEDQADSYVLTITLK